MTSIGHPVTRSVYAAVLKKGVPSPIPPQSDEEKAKDADKERKDGAAAPADAEEGGGQGEGRQGAGRRRPRRRSRWRSTSTASTSASSRCRSRRKNYRGLFAGKEGKLFLVEGPLVEALGDGPPKLDVSRFDLETRKAEPLLEGVSAFALSANGEKVLYRSGPAWHIVGSDKAPKGGDGALADEGPQGVRRPEGGVGADVPRGLADRARLLLRPALPRPRSRGGREGLRAVPRRDREPRRPERAVRGDDRQPRPSGTRSSAAAPSPRATR